MKRKTIKMIAGLVALLLVAIFIAGEKSESQSGNAVLQGESVTGESTAVSIPVSSISESAKWFEYDARGTPIRFFAVKASDGSIKTAFDACDVCFSSKKGFRQEESYMVCNNCGNRYPIAGLGTENRNPGGCWSSYLPNQVMESEIVITKSDLLSGLTKF